MSNSVIVKRLPIHYKNDVRVYVPVFQRNFDEDGNLLFSPTFEYSYSDATSDEQMAWSFKPDYVLMLSGTFDVVTKDLVIKDADEEDVKP